MLIECKDILRKLGIFIAQHRAKSPVDANIDFLYRSGHLAVPNDVANATLSERNDQWTTRRKLEMHNLSAN